MSQKGVVFFLTIFSILILMGCYVVPVQPTPTVEWVPVKLTAKGSGAPPLKAMNPAQARLMTERSAKLDALRNLLEQAYGVNITSTSTVRDFITQNDTIRSRVDAFIRGAKVVDTRYLDDGSVEVEMELVLGYEFRRIFP